MITRRGFLAASSALVACGGKTDMGLPLDPWHMWGDTIIVTTRNSGPIATGQLARINYGRPETWRFLFAAKLIAAPVIGAGLSPVVSVAIDLIVGVGRSSMQLGSRENSVGMNLGGFVNFVFAWPVAAQPPLNAKWATSTLSPPLDDGEPLIVTPVDHFSAQDVQASARVEFTGGGAPDTEEVQVEIHAYFSPNMHLRPEWFIEQFRGSEQGGS